MTRGPDSTVVFASAGTGKTFRLTNRYIALLAAGEEPRTLVAATFTRKAAGEILERIVERLAAGARGGEALEELQEHAAASLTAGRCAELLEALLRELPRVRIGTIDSLFLKIASAFALELELPADWAICEEDVDAELRQGALEEVIEAGDAEHLLTLIQMLLAGEEPRTVIASVLRPLDEAYSLFLQTLHDPGLWRTWEPDWAGLSAAELADLCKRLDDLFPVMSASGRPNGHWVKLKEKLCDRTADGDWEWLLANSLVRCIIEGTAPRYQRHVAPEEWLEVLRPLTRHAQREVMARVHERCVALAAMLAAFHERYDAMKRRLGLLRFDDVPRLIDSGGTLGALEHLYYRLDGSIRHVLLDEFQDTSHAQFRLLAPILDELLSADDGRTAFVVGDAKQSLYGWREAEPELLEAMPERWERLERDSMQKSWRSSQTVLDVVNRVFGSLASNPVLEGEAAVEDWIGRFERHVAAKDLDGEVVLEVAPDAPMQEDDADSENGGEATDGIAAAVRLAAQRVKEILGRAPGASVGVLVRRNKPIAAMIQALREAGVAASAEGGSPVTDASAVTAALALLRLADHPGDTLAIFHVATSPIGEALGLNDPGDKERARLVAAQVRERLGRDGYAQTLLWLLHNHRLATRMSRREAERFEQLIDLAQRFDARPPARAGAFIALARGERMAAPEGAQVRVMTVHQAKGLEFDAVVLCELDERMSPRGARVIGSRDDPLGELTRVCVYPNETLKAADSRLAHLYEDYRRRCVGEGLSVLYVAMTRARHALWMIVDPLAPEAKRTSPTAARVLCEALAPGQERAPEAVLFGQRRGDWTRAFKKIPPPPEAAEVPLRLGPSAQRSAGRLARRSPARLSEDDGWARGLFMTGGGDSRQRGLLVHAWMERIGWLDDGTPDEAELLAIAAASGVDAEVARATLPAFAEALARPAVRELLSRPAGTPPRIRQELPFAVRIEHEGEEVLLTGRFDRLLVWGEAGAAERAEVVDFKTDAGADAAATAPARHAPQMRAYRRAAAKLLGIREDRVSCRVVLLESGDVVQVQ